MFQLCSKIFMEECWSLQNNIIYGLFHAIIQSQSLHTGQSQRVKEESNPPAALPKEFHQSKV